MKITDAKLHLSTVIEGEENVDAFLVAIMQKLNNITFNGERKITEVKQIGSSTAITIAPYKKMKIEKYWLRLDKMSEVTLD